jgi:hypothetical protein
MRLGASQTGRRYRISRMDRRRPTAPLKICGAPRRQGPTDRGQRPGGVGLNYTAQANQITTAVTSKHNRESFRSDDRLGVAANRVEWLGVMNDASLFTERVAYAMYEHWQSGEYLHFGLGINQEGRAMTPRTSFMIFGQAAVRGSEVVGPNHRLWREQAPRQELRTVVLLSPRVV